ncbi:nucleoside-diphosphate-sugar epimerase [Rhodovulum bhavnagarense]|uniref:Nucleoside-diphosphate-sugar epimerase n=1 Tax=Rhodovulum bhavnagarense TaxID=992286 RepID=A0A4R2R6K0_9RHOB|nr:NAD(P)-dependent oxidoreductase [Rhodovulum bhavnagarense]TCP58680.1 nucleoside-diphosphate-sugar epimerase [Rhodovulum bhavnagarense]
MAAWQGLMVGPRVLVLGASGRLGRMLRRGWAGADLRPVWQLRHEPAGVDEVVWSPLGAPVPEILSGRIDVVLGLAGVVPRPGAALGDNARLGLAALRAGHAVGARHVFLASSVAVYGRGEAPHSEDEAPAPAAAYGRAKLEMEQAARAEVRAIGPGAPGLTCLRIGNVAGADALLGGSVATWQTTPSDRRVPLVLDRFGDGPAAPGPRRAYIGPQSLAKVLACLCRHAMTGPLPDCLNIAAPGVVDMAALLGETGLVAGRDWTWRAAAAGALPMLALDDARLARLCALPPCAGTAAGLVAEWRAMQADGV